MSFFTPLDPDKVPVSSLPAPAPDEGLIATPPMFENLKLDPDKLAQLGMRLQVEIQHFQDRTRTRRDNAREWRDAAKLMPDSGEGPWDFSSDLRATDTRRVCQSHATRLNNQILGQDPPFTAVAKKPEAVEAAPEIEESLAALLEEADWKRCARLTHKEMTIACPPAVRVTWEQRYEKRPMTQVEHDEDAHLAALEAGVSPTVAYLTSAMGKDGRITPKSGWQTVLAKDGCDLRTIPYEDVVWFPVTARRDDELWGVGERIFLRGMDLAAGVKTGTYIKEQVDLLLRQASTPTNEERRDRLETEGIDGSPYPTLLDQQPYREYECYETCWRDDLDEDGEIEWYIVTVHLQTRLVIRCMYSPYWHGQPYYVLFPYDEEGGELTGMSPAELIANLQNANSSALQQFENLLAMLASSKGAFMYDDTAGLDLDNFNLDIGKPIHLKTLTGVQPNPLYQQIPEALESILKFLDWTKNQIDLVASTSDPALGKETEQKRTLGEVQLVLSQSMQIFEDNAAGVALRWAKVWDLVRWNYAQFGGKNGGQIPFRRSASAKPQQIAPPAPPPAQPGQEMGGMGAPQPSFLDRFRGFLGFGADNGGAEAQMPSAGPQNGVPGAFGGAPSGPFAGLQGGGPPSGAPMMGAGGAPAGGLPGMGAPPLPGGPPGTPMPGVGGMMGGPPAGMPTAQAAPEPEPFGEISMETLTADVDLVPAGIGAFPDQQSRIQRDMMLLQVFGTNPMTAQAPHIQALLLKQLVQDSRLPDKEQLTQMLDDLVQSLQQQQMMQQALMMQQAQAQQQMADQQGAEQERQAQLQQAQAQQGAEQHQLGQAQGAQDMALGGLQQLAQIHSLLNPPPAKNGGKK